MKLEFTDRHVYNNNNNNDVSGDDHNDVSGDDHNDDYYTQDDGDIIYRDFIETTYFHIFKTNKFMYVASFQCVENMNRHFVTLIDTHGYKLVNTSSMNDFFKLSSSLDRQISGEILCQNIDNYHKISDVDFDLFGCSAVIVPTGTDDQLVHTQVRLIIEYVKTEFFEISDWRKDCQLHACYMTSMHPFYILYTDLIGNFVFTHFCFDSGMIRKNSFRMSKHEAIQSLHVWLHLSCSKSANFDFNNVLREEGIHYANMFIATRCLHVYNNNLFRIDASDQTLDQAYVY